MLEERPFCMRHGMILAVVVAFDKTALREKDRRNKK